MSKNIYHSALVQACRDDGPQEITLTSDKPLDSKFKDKPPYFSVKYDGEDRYYPIENDDCAEALTGLKGKTVRIMATGSRDDAAIEVVGESRRSEPRTATGSGTPRGAAASKQRTPEERAADEEKAFRRMKMRGARVAIAIQASLKFAKDLVEKELPDATTEDVRAIALCHFIEIKGSTDMEALPLKWLDLKAAAPQQRQPEPPPEPEPEPAADEDLDDIPF